MVSVKNVSTKKLSIHQPRKEFYGSLLEQLWKKSIITDRQFLYGMSYSLFHARVHRSLGIQTRLKASGHFVEKLIGRPIDTFENALLEKSWSYLQKILNSFDKGPFIKETLSILVSDTTQSVEKHASFETPFCLYKKYQRILNILADSFENLEYTKLKTDIPKEIWRLMIFKKKKI